MGKRKEFDFDLFGGKHMKKRTKKILKNIWALALANQSLVCSYSDRDDMKEIANKLLEEMEKLLPIY
jgi:hypothetical protein